MNSENRAFELFAETLKSTASIPDEEIEWIFSISKVAHFEKGQHFIRAGQIPVKFAFLARGLFRYYYLNDSGHEFTKGFFLEKTFLSSYSAMIQNRESFFSIEALEPSMIIVVPYLRWHESAKTRLCWQQFLVSLLEKGYCNKENRERELLLFDAEKRYRLFLESYPGLEQRVKQHHIASYLGITPVSLSRIRKKIAR